MAHAMKSLKLYEIGERKTYCGSESMKLLTNLPNLNKGGVNEWRMLKQSGYGFPWVKILS